MVCDNTDYRWGQTIEYQLTPEQLRYLKGKFRDGGDKVDLLYEDPDDPRHGASCLEITSAPFMRDMSDKRFVALPKSACEEACTALAEVFGQADRFRALQDAVASVTAER